jgi:multiple sugar transport system permease protein
VGQKLGLTNAVRVAACVVATAVLVFPLYWMLVTAIQPTSDLVTMDLSLVPRTITLDGFVALFKHNAVTSWLGVSTVLSLGSAAISLVISICAGYALSRSTGRGHQVMGFALLLSRMLPGSLLVVPFYVIFLRLGLINNVFSVVLVNTVFIVPFATWLLKGFFDGIPRELEEAAWVDGAGRIRALCSVVLPLSAPGIAAAATYSTIFGWGDFLFARTLLTTDRNWPVTVGIASFIGDNGTDWNSIMAMALVAVVPMMVLFILAERHLIAGLTAGGVKG